MLTSSRTYAERPALYPFQDVGIDWLTRQFIAGFLGDDMGLGKTIQAIDAMNAVCPRGAVLVVAPTVGIYNWESEIQEWSRISRPVQVIDKGITRVDPHVIAQGGVVIVTHGLIARPSLRLQLIDHVWDVLIVDEADAFRNPKAKRTMALYGDGCRRSVGCLAAAAKRVWLLSGTPTPNGHAVELWTHLHALRPDLITLSPGGRPLSRHAFTKRYCITRASTYGLMIVGNRKTTLPELRTKVIKPFVLRRLKERVLPDLPEIRYDLVAVGTDHIPDALKKLEKELNGPLRELLDRFDDGGDPKEVLASLGRQGIYDAEKAEYERTPLSRLRRLTGHLKVHPTIELLREHRAQAPGTKLILFGVHLDVLRGLQEAAIADGWGTVLVTGDVKAKDRQAAVVKFQTDPECQLFIGQVAACGVAITLTAAAEVIFMEASWLPGVNTQAADRTHRIGQKLKVRVRFLALAGSVDDALMRALVRKVRSGHQMFAS
jgi:SWI/SNF-related matrix-associated actin-dependent regulator 1 of chromatin subfamily A